MNDLDKYFNEEYPVIKTRNNVKSQINKLLIYTKKNFKDSINDIEALKYLGLEMKNKKGQYMINTNTSTISCIMSFIDKYRKLHPDIITDENYNQIREINLELRKKKSAHADLQSPTTTNTLQDFYTLMDMYDEDTIEYLYLACNLFMPPRRLEWRFAVFVEQLPEKLEKINYIVLGGKYVRLVFNNIKFQVLKSLGIWDRTLCNSNFVYLKYTDIFSRINPEKLGQLLKESYNNKNRYYVFDGKTTESKFNKFIKKIFSKHHQRMIQTNMRHLICDELDKLKVSAKYKRAIAHDCGQKSLETQMLYCSRKPESEDNEEEYEESIVSELSPNDINNLIEGINISRHTSTDTISIDENDTSSYYDNQNIDLDQIEINLLHTINETVSLLKKHKEDLRIYREIKKKYM